MSEASAGADVTYKVTSVVNASLDIKDSQNVMVSLLWKLKWSISSVFSNLETPIIRSFACQCSLIGTKNCDVKGRCTCTDGYQGTKCDECQVGFAKNSTGACIRKISLLLQDKYWPIRAWVWLISVQIVCAISEDQMELPATVTFNAIARLITKA